MSWNFVRLMPFMHISKKNIKKNKKIIKQKNVVNKVFGMGLIPQVHSTLSLYSFVRFELIFQLGCEVDVLVLLVVEVYLLPCLLASSSHLS